MKVGLRQCALLLLVFAACEGDAPALAPKLESVEAVKVETVQPSPRAVLGKVQGEVTVKRAAGDEWLEATETMKLFDNDKVRTARGASAEVRFTSGSRLTVGEDALVGIAESQPLPGTDPSDITVLKGRIDAQLVDAENQSLIVNTPAATIRAGREIVFQ